MAKNKKCPISFNAMVYLLEIYCLQSEECFPKPKSETYIKELVEQDIVTLTGNNPVITEKGKIYIKALGKVKLPVQKWV